MTAQITQTDLKKPLPSNLKGGCEICKKTFKRVKLGRKSARGLLNVPLSVQIIADGVEKMFRNSAHEISYGEEELKPIVYQNDIARASDSAEAA